MDEVIYEKIYRANIKLVDDNSTLKNDIEILEKRMKRAVEYIQDNSAFDGSSMCKNDLLRILKGERLDDKKLELP